MCYKPGHFINSQQGNLYSKIATPRRTAVNQFAFFGYEERGLLFTAGL